MTEADIQNQLYCSHLGRGCCLAIPNSNLLGWESDFLVVTRALLCHDFEIKLTRADFMRDAAKDKLRDMRAWIAGERGLDVVSTFGCYSLPISQPANYFWYVCPEGVIAVELVPEWAGLAWVNDSGHLRFVKRAARLHREKLKSTRLMRLVTSVNFRYWNMRLQRQRQVEP